MRACKTCRFYLRSPREYLTWHDGDLVDMEIPPLAENLGIANEAHVLACHEENVDDVVDL